MTFPCHITGCKRVATMIVGPALYQGTPTCAKHKEQVERLWLTQRPGEPLFTQFLRAEVTP